MSVISENDSRRRTRSLRLAVALVLFAAAVYGGFILLVHVRGGP